MERNNMAGRVLQVKVVSKAGDKTVVGLHVFLSQHPIYKKYIKKQKKYMIHDETNKVQVGDMVYIRETKPISKRKTWVIFSDKSAS
jgi:small subunit ribosomal protein S17